LTGSCYILKINTLNTHLIHIKFTHTKKLNLGVKNPEIYCLKKIQ